MSGRRGQGQMPNFDASFSRRPNNSAQNISSLLGEPPSSQSKNTNYSKNPFSSGNNGGGNYNDNYSRRDSFPSGGGGGGQNFGGNNNNNNSGRSNQRMSDDFGGRQGGGQGGGNFGQQNRFEQGGGNNNNQQDAFVSGWGQRAPSPNRFNNRGSDSPPVPRDRNPAWNTNQNSGMDFDNSAKQQHLLAQQNLFNAEISRFRDGGNASNNSMQGLNMGQMNQMPQEQQGAPPVVMVMPQGQGAAGGMMGMMQANPNPFNVLAGQQRPMQVILGNLPAFNPDVFGQQILQGVGGAFGQGMIPQNMGIMSQQQQQPSQQFNRFNDNSGPGRSNFNNSSDRSNNSSRGQNQNRSSSSNMGNRSSGRRSDSNANNRNSDGRGGVGGNNSTPSRDQRKRGGAVLRDPIPDDGVDRKRAKHSGNQQNNKGNNRNNRGGQQNRTGNNAAGGNKNKKANNKQNNKVNDKVKKEEDKDKKEVKADDKKTEETKDKKDIKTDEKTEDMDTSTVEEDGKEKQKEKKVSKYDEFPASLLVCKICQKVMNDGSSFESHLNGRAHLALVKILEQRFQKRTELLMQESKLAEDEIGVEMERQRRAGKNNQSGKNSKNYCKMCDCNYMVNWGTHKVSLGHRILKEFLHPTCRICNAHFVHRADWIAHLITLSHLRRLVELKNEGADMTCHESATQDELFAISIDMSGDDHITNAITIKAIEPQVIVKEDMSAMLSNGKDELVVPEGEIAIPETYDEAVPVGEEAIMTVAGFCCKVCRQFIADEADVQPHLKSKTHFNIYVAYLKQMVKLREQKAEEEKKAAEEAEKKAQKEKEDEEKKAAEEAEAEKVAKDEAEKKAETADEDKKDETEEIKEESAVDEKVESVVEKSEDDKLDTTTPSEDKDEFVVEEEIGGDEETNGLAEETKTESSPEKVEEKEAEVKAEEKPEEKKDVKSEEIKEAETKPAEKKEAEPIVSTPKPQNNQNRGRGSNRGPGGGRGRGANTPSVNKPTTRVETPMRGGRGQNSARSPRGGNQRGGNTGGGNWRGGARGGRGRPFQR